VSPRRIGDALADLLRDGDAYRARCWEVRNALRGPLGDGRPAQRVAEALRPWLA
jgi:hypothetical protein